jgi:hypothetical protein
MREHGVDMPDPKPGSGGTIQIGGPGQDQAKVDAAMKACQAFMQGGMGDPNDPKAKDRQAKMNKCLRKMGLNVTDGANGMPVMPPNTSQEKMQAAVTACARQIGSGK